MGRITKNTFKNALNFDTDAQSLSPEYYIDAQNLTLTADSKFTSLKDFPGTISLGSITGGINTLLNANVKTVFAKFKIGDVSNINCLVFFITGVEAGDQGAFYITVYDLDNSVLYYCYKQQNLGTDYFDEHRIVDTRSFAENSIDLIYFTDASNELRQLRCEIGFGAGDYFLNDYDLSLTRRGANGTVTGLTLSTGGTLLSGTYQYAYRMVDPLKKRFTKWSSLTNPIHVYESAISGQPVYSSVGLATSKSIQVTVNPSPDEYNNFAYYQLAVIENIYALSSAVQPASVLPIQIATGTTYTYHHVSNEKISTIPIEDIVIDLAAIQSAKTLAIKQDYLFAGDIKYKDLEFDNGTPVAIGTIITATTGSSRGDSYSDDTFSTTNRGYFRDETYRFGIVYKDKYGNRSPVSVLDLNAITDNQNTTSGPDVHFPGRSVKNTYSLFNGTKLRGLGLGLTNIQNHPTWATGFEIVRAKRIKKILFQTPLVPTTFVQGVGAVIDYPSKAVTVANQAANSLTPDAQPQTNSKVYLPMNLFWPEMRAIEVNPNALGSGGINTTIASEAGLGVGNNGVYSNFTYAEIFPQNSMYGDTPYLFAGNEKLQQVDYCITKLNFANFNTGVTPGDNVNTKVSGTFYALNDGDYYFDSTWTGKTIPSDLIGVKDYEFLPNASPGVVFGGSKFLDYGALYGTGVDFGYQPQVQKAGLIAMGTSLTALSTTGSYVFANGTLNQHAVLGTEYIVGSSGPQYEYAQTVTNNYVTNYSGFVADSSYVQNFRIVNVINDFGDDRYGNINTAHEFISTGASYVFSPSELVNVQAGTPVPINLNVFGGDCFTSVHTFKVSDSWYSVVDQGKYSSPPAGDSSTDLITKWKKYYLTYGGDAAVSLPIGVSGAAQFIEIVLESEYNGGVIGQDIINSVGNVNGIPIMGLSTTNNTEGAIHSPLLYNYNINISKQNDQKVYFTRQPFSFVQYEFKSRIAISDIKIYGTDVQGFDIFRVGSIFDLEENKGGLTKLAIAEDAMYAIQETGIVYLPTGQTQLEQTDAGILAVGINKVIGRPIIIDQFNGSQHMNGIAESGSAIYIPNNLNKEVYKLQGQQLIPLHNFNFNTKARELFAEAIPENNLIGIFDQDRDEYWMVDNTNLTCFVFNEKVNESGAWVSNYEFYDADDSLSSACWGGIYGNNRLYINSFRLIAGKVDIGAHTMYRGANATMFGRPKTPRVTISINPDSDISKTFDDMSFAATDRLDSMDLVVHREADLSDQTVSGTTLDALSIEGNYRVKVLRDVQKARLRGLYMLATIKWKPGNAISTGLTSILTKYRLSARTPY